MSFRRFWLVARHELTRTLQQRFEKLKRLIREIDPDATLPQVAGAQIQLEGAKARERIEGSAHSRSGP